MLTTEKQTQNFAALQKPELECLENVKNILGVSSQEVLSSGEKADVVESIPTDHPVREFLLDRTLQKPHHDHRDILENLRWLGIDSRAIVTTKTQEKNDEIGEHSNMIVSYTNDDEGTITSAVSALKSRIMTGEIGDRYIIPLPDVLKLLQAFAYNLNLFYVTIGDKYIFTEREHDRTFSGAFCTLLHLAVMYNQINVVKALVDPKAAIEDARSEIGEENYNEYRQNLEQGFFPQYDVNCTNGFGLTPLDYNHGHRTENCGELCGTSLSRRDYLTKMAIMEFLESKGAQLSDKIAQRESGDKQRTEEAKHKQHELLTNKQWLTLCCVSAFAILSIAKPDLLKSALFGLKDQVMKYLGKMPEGIDHERSL